MKTPDSHHVTTTPAGCRRWSPRHLSVLVHLLLAPLFAGAAAGADGPAVGVRAGTLGIGPEVTVPLGGAVHLRLGVFAADHGDTYDETGIDYDADLELRNGTVLFDWHPGGGIFRLSAGAAWNDTELVATAPLEDLLRREVANLPPIGVDLGTLRGTATVDPVGPYLGLGFGNPFDGGRWGFTFDFGVVHHGTPEVELIADTQIPIGLIPGGQQALDRELAEEEAALEDEIDDYRYLPVISFGITYSF